VFFSSNEIEDPEGGDGCLECGGYLEDHDGYFECEDCGMEYEDPFSPFYEDPDEDPDDDWPYGDADEEYNPLRRSEDGPHRRR